jgi:FkbM family methyltransferase
MTEPKTGPARVERLLDQVRTLGIKAQLQLFDSIKDSLIVEGRHGIRYTTRSVLEYKRSTKDKAWDAPIEEWIATFTPGDVFFDIGANVGTFSLLAGTLHRDQIKVYAVEPAFENFEALMRNILTNDLSDVITALPIGLFETTGVNVFNYRSMGAGSARHALGSPVDHTGKSFAPVAQQPMLAFRLDDLIDLFQLPRPTRIKLDVDGIEPRVIAGASRTLSSGPCDLWVELTKMGEDDDATSHVTRELGRLGFTMAREVRHERTVDDAQVYDVLYVRR